MAIRDWIAWFFRPMAFRRGLSTLVIISVIPRKSTPQPMEMSGLIHISTMQMDTATTISVVIWISTRINWKALGISLSVSRNTVGMSAPR